MYFEYGIKNKRVNSTQTVYILRSVRFRKKEERKKLKCLVRVFFLNLMV